MSTKIYDGLKATDRNVFRAAEATRAVLDKVFFEHFVAAEQKAKERAGERWGEMFRSTPGVEEKYLSAEIPTSPWSRTEQLYDIIVNLQNTSMHTFSELDFGYEAILMPNGRGVTVEPLLLVFAAHNGDEYRQALTDAGVATEYGYWNNTDEPEGMSNREWGQRKKAWSTLDIPARDGLKLMMPTRFEAIWKVTQPLT